MNGFRSRRSFVQWSAVLVLLLALVLAAPAVRADDDDEAVCTGLVVSVTIPGDLVVPPNHQCILVDVTVEGSVRALENTEVFIINESRIAKDFEADRVAVLVIEQSVVGGELEVIGSGFVPTLCCDPAMLVHLSDIGGKTTVKGVNFTTLELNSNVLHDDLVLIRNGPDVLSMDVFGNLIDGNVHVRRNSGPFRIEGNVIGGHGGHAHIVHNTAPGGVVANNSARQLVCRHNAEPFVGGPNPNAEKARGQCFK